MTQVVEEGRGAASESTAAGAPGPTGAPVLPVGRIPLQAPPDQVEAAGAGNILATMIPMMGSMGVMVFMAMSQGNNPRMLIMGGVMVVAMLSMVGFNIYRQVGGHRRQVSTQRREYLAYLSEMRDTVRTAARRQRAYTNWMMPDPEALVLVAQDGARVWEREVGDADILHVRLGTSVQDLSMELEEPELPPLANPDVVCHSAMARFVDAHSTVDDMPFGVALAQFSHVEVAGDREQTRSQVRAMVMHLATFVPPGALRIAVLCSEDARPQWEWMKWLPHARSAEESDALGPARMVVSDAADLADLLGEEVTTRGAFRTDGGGAQWPHVLVVVDDATLPPTTRLGSREGTSGVTVVTMPTQWGALTSTTTLRLVLTPPIHPGTSGDRGGMQAVMLDRDPVPGVPDVMGVAQAEAVARRMAPWIQKEREESSAPLGRSDPKRSADLMDLLGIGDVREFDPDRLWRRRDGRDRLRVPIGVTPEGVPVSLDIKESAEQGMGPHGLLIGATGSGKSEVLRTLVLALSLTHSPDQLNFVLVDFKGGATFAGMAGLPHVSAMISNLESELSLVDRMQDALRGEMVRRQELLREAGNFANVGDYEAARLAGRHDGPALPALFIVLDEFSELLAARPEFIDLFVAIGRLGRSMSIHLLLASQRLEEGRLRGLDSHLSYRIGLRTFSAGESRTVLGVPDAYELPPVPGVGFLKPGTDELIRFRASYVATPPPARSASSASVAARGRAGAPGGEIRVLPFTSAPLLSRESSGGLTSIDEAAPAAGATSPAGSTPGAELTEMDIAVARMAGHGTPAHQVWLPPLEEPDTLDALMPDLAVDPQLGLVSHRWRDAGRLCVPLGTVDVPLEQRRETLVVDLSGAGGHVGVVGGPLSGKSTALRTLVMSLSLTHTPQEVQFYVMDFGGGGFLTLRDAPHVAGVATRDRPDVVQRMLAEVESIIDDREKYFRDHRIDSMGTYREERAQGRLDDGYGDVFLVVDGWSTLRSDFDGLDARIQEMLPRSLTYGVHLVVGTGRWMDLRQQISDVIGTVIELRLGDPTDSRVHRRIAEQVPEGRPGRGLEAGEHHMLIALPRTDGDHDPTTTSRGITLTVERIVGALPAGRGPRLRLLPTRIDLETARGLEAADPAGLVLGVEGARLGALSFDPATESHLYLFGDARSGKSTFLRGLTREIRRTRTPEQAQVFAIDPRRALLDEVPEDHLAGYWTTREEATSQLRDLATFLRTRLPGPSVTADQLRTRSWWAGAEAWILVDDYDLVSTRSGNPLDALTSLLAQAQDVGLHVVVARRMGGASRAVFEPFLQTLAELGTTGIMLSGNPDEGPVIGRVRPVRAPAGRAQVISRDAGLISAQLAWSEPVV